MKSLVEVVEDGRLKVRRAHHLYQMRRLSQTVADMTEVWTKSLIGATGAFGRLAAAFRAVSTGEARRVAHEVIGPGS